MANTIAFQAMGKTYRVNASTSGSNVTITSDGPATAYLVANQDAGNAAFVFISPGGAPVAANAAPNVGNAAYGMYIIGGQTKVFTGPPCPGGNTGNVFVSVTCIAGTPGVFITPGEGI